MKGIYLYDENTKKFIGSDVIEKGEEMPANATEVAPLNEDGTGMYDPKWDGEKWVGKSYEEWAKENPTEAHEPSDIEQALTKLSEQLAEEQEQLNELQKVITNMNMDGDK